MLGIVLSLRELEVQPVLKYEEQMRPHFKFDGLNVGGVALFGQENVLNTSPPL